MTDKARDFGASKPGRLSWALAGGTAPLFAAADLGGGAVAIPLGTGAVRSSSFIRVEGECFATCHIVGGTGASAGTGLWVIDGLPVLPKQDAAGIGRVIGHGRLVDTSEDGQVWDVVVLSDATHGTKPYLGLARDAAGVPLLTSDDTAIVHDDNPFDFDDGDVLDLTMQFEGA